MFLSQTEVKMMQLTVTAAASPHGCDKFKQRQFLSENKNLIILCLCWKENVCASLQVLSELLAECGSRTGDERWRLIGINRNILILMPLSVLF